MTSSTDYADAAARLERLARRIDGELSAYFSPFHCDSQIAGTLTRVRCSTLRADRRGPRVKDLARKLKEYVVDFAIPRSRITEALTSAHSTRSAAPIVRLESEASRLFTRLITSGEGGELLLYALAERVLGIPQIMCKMPLKTSTAMHVHGTDGVHAAFNVGTGSLALYWGESKLHKSPTAAIDACFESLVPFLTSPGGSAGTSERDLQLIRDNIDLEDAELEDAVLGYLNPDDPRFLKLEYRGLCLVGFDDGAYTHLPAAEKQFEDEILRGIEKWRSRIQERIRDHCVEAIEIELFCVPLPSVQVFRDAMLAELKGEE